MSAEKLFGMYGKEKRGLYTHLTFGKEKKIFGPIAMALQAHSDFDLMNELIVRPTDLSYQSGVKILPTPKT